VRSKELVGDAGPLPSLEEAGECDVLAFAGVGRVPQKEPIRIPIGLALTLTADMLSPFDRGRANELAAKGLVTWVNFPSLAKGSGRRGEAAITVDGRAVATERALDIEAEVRAAYAEAVQLVRTLCERDGEVTLAQVRDATGSSRKVVQALLERMDADGITRRTGDVRILRRGAAT
jgi:hypothetical protein